MAEPDQIAEPPAWREIIADPVFVAAPVEQKTRIFDEWERDNRAFAKTIGATDDELNAFHTDLRNQWGAQLANTGAAQAVDAATLPGRLDWSEVSDARKAIERDNLLAAADVEDQAELTTGRSGRGKALREQAAALESQIVNVPQGYEPRSDAPAGAGGGTPQNPALSFLGPALTSTVESPMGRGFTSSLGATAGGAAGAGLALALAGPTGGASLLFGLGGGLLGGMAGAAGQEALTQAVEQPDATQERLEANQRAAESEPGLYGAGRLLGTGALFRPSASELRGVVTGTPGARFNMAAAGGLGAGGEIGASLLQGQPLDAGRIVQSGLENMLLSRPNMLAQRMFGLRPAEIIPDPATQTTRTPIGTLGPDGGIVEPGSAEGTALQALTGLDATAPVPGEAPPVEQAPVSPLTPSPQDIVPAIEVQGQVVRGNPGDTHQDVLNRFIEANPDAAADALADFDTKANPNFFAGPDDARISREQLQEQFGVRDSQGLRDLQSKPAEATNLDTQAVPAESVPAEGDKISPIEPTGIRNAIVDPARAAAGIPEREVPGKRTFGTLWDEAKAAVAQDPLVGRRLVDELKTQVRPLTDVEDAILTYEQTQREAAHAAAVEEVNSATTDEAREAAQTKLAQAENDIFDVYQTGQSAGTANARGLNARRLMINRDYTLAKMLNETRAKVNDGAPLSDKQRAEITVLHTKIADLESRLATADEKTEARTAKTEYDRLISQTRKEAKTAAKSRKSLVDFMDEQAAKARDRIIARRGKLLSTIDPLNLAGLADEIVIGASHVARGVRDFAQWSKRMVNDFGERIRPHLDAMFSRASQMADESAKQFTPEPTPQEVLAQANAAQPLEQKMVFDLARAHVRAGVEGFENVMKAVHADLAPIYEGITEREIRDAFSGYGKIRTPSKAEDLKQLREYRNLARLTSQLEDAQRGIAPLKTGQQRDKTTARVRELQKQVNEAMRAAGLNQGTPEQLASGLDAAKTRIRNSIEDLQRRIAANDYEPRPKREPASDQEKLNLQYELAKTKEEYNKGLIEAKMAKRSTARKVIDTGQEIMNASRAVLTSADLSAVLRQGGFIGLGNPVRAAKGLPDMFKALLSEKAEFRVMRDIANRPNAPLYEQSKLFLAKEGNSLTQLEEAFMSRWAQKIPGVKASQRAYNTFLNKLRADTFDSMVAGLGAATPAETKAIANYINAATGRGKLGLRSLEQNAGALNTIFFAPRFVASRFQLLGGALKAVGDTATGFQFNPATARARKAIAAEYAKYLAGISVVMGLGLLAGGEIEKDPRSSQAGKIRFGNTYLDPFSGLAQSSTLVSRLATGETKTGKGKVVPIRGDKVPFGSGDSASVIGRFLRTKLSPAVGAGVDLITGRNVVGEKVTPGQVAMRAAVPLSFGEILQTMENQGVPRGTALTVLSLFGMGLQNYERR